MLLDRIEMSTYIPKNTFYSVIAKSENKQNEHLAIVYFLFCQRHFMLYLAGGLFDMDPWPGK